MINIPKKISANGHDCVVASVVMVCMYWRAVKPNLSWNLPTDYNHENWTKVIEKGQTYVRTSGMPFNNIKKFLRTLKLPLTAKLELLEDAFVLRNLIRANVPPIVIYDRNYFFKNQPGIGHAVVLVEHTQEMFTSVDPSFSPKFIHKLAKPDFEDAWKLKKNATIIIYPKTYKINAKKAPATTLLNYARQKKGLQ